MFAVEEEDDREEEMFALVDRHQWSTQRAADPPLSPELQQMFALARRMGYEMRPIARRFDASTLPDRCRALDRSRIRIIALH